MLRPLARSRLPLSLLVSRRSIGHTTFPADLPKPIDDGTCDHLTALAIPPVPLQSTGESGDLVDVSKLKGLSIIFCYPRTGAPNETIPPEWDAIPGARGCTPQACSFRDNLPDLKQNGVKNLFGLSTQSTSYQQEVCNRIHLPYELLSDSKLDFLRVLKIPTFEYRGQTLIKRLTLAIEDGTIIKYWYPVFPPDSNAHEVIKWLQTQDRQKA